MTISPSRTTNLPEYCQAQLPTATSLLEELVNLNSHSMNVEGVNLVQARLAEQFSRLGMNPQLYPIRDRGNVLIATTLACRDSDKHILLVGHADTVHEAGKESRPFTRDAERLYGPGVFDMKAGLVVIDLALRALKDLEMLDRIPIRVIVNSAEEDSTNESREFMSRCAQLARAALVFEFGRANDAIVTSRKGFAAYSLNVKGRPAHAGNNIQDGASAITQLGYMLPELAALTDPEREITCNVGTIDGGTKTSVVAAEARATFEMRAAQASDITRLEEQVRRFAIRVPGTSFDLTREKLIPPLEETARGLKLFNAYKQAAFRAGLSLDRHPRVGGLSDANNLGVTGLPVIDALGPAGGGAHTDEEYVVAASLVPKTLSLIYFLTHLPEARGLV